MFAHRQPRFQVRKIDASVTDPQILSARLKCIQHVKVEHDSKLKTYLGLERDHFVPKRLELLKLLGGGVGGLVLSLLE